MHKRATGLGVIRPEMRVLVAVDEAASLLSVGRSAVYELVMTGANRSVKVGRNRRIVVEPIREYVGVLLEMVS